MALLGGLFFRYFFWDWLGVPSNPLRAIIQILREQKRMTRKKRVMKSLGRLETWATDIEDEPAGGPFNSRYA